MPEIVKYESHTFSDDDKTKLFDMYSNTYSKANEELWFKTPDELFKRYPCLLSYENAYLKFYVMFQFKKNTNKISLICHDSTTESKNALMALLSELLRQPGYILEASGAVSWVLRKNKTPIIYNIDQINNLLDITPENVNDRIVINPKFDIKNKNTQMYTRTYISPEGTTYTTADTLFGTDGCTFEENTNNCSRTCKLGGGETQQNSQIPQIQKEQAQGRSQIKKTLSIIYCNQFSNK